MLKDDGVDPHGGLQYSRYDRTRVERVWKETLTKERDLRQDAQKQNGPANYVMNLANLNAAGGLLRLNHSHSRLEIITEKVEKHSPRTRGSLEGFDPSGFEFNVMKHSQKTPTKKWDLPCTSAQEVGWLIANHATHQALRQRQKAKGYSPSGASLEGLRSSKSAPSVSAHLPSAPPLPELQCVNTRCNPRSYRPKNFCPITRYADTYVALMHHDPFNQAAAGR
mmetsp:Transcript_60033/g.166174  ORF Transcript_60033/g.166174 Transcript_60033/m.166174 type:complete len:223 (-) Transcript_60033:118-786(-)|eukprot:CAMPEP_0179076092 /NCGR_PEP_ID=MMETSP0796-20121207/33925_1 /TAXON_ID=73915 /ORGANISM="Pyrodinium bahamense, Strain pbaha01" /LENGTH=222 /DNA_ID=CAMNT_0020773339 /DNA_START=112 /DNA_END=780 /DNA_ORIENTATION=+